MPKNPEPIEEKRDSIQTKSDEESLKESSESSDESSSDDQEEQKFKIVQRYSKQKPLVIKREQVHRLREPEIFEDKKVVVKI